MSGFTVAAPAVQDALAALLETGFSDETVRVSLGWPSGGIDETHVRILGGFNARLSRHTSGGAQRDEESTLTVRVLVTMSADDMATVRDRAVELADIVESVVSQNPTMDGATKWARVTAYDATEGVLTDDRRQYGIDMTVTYQTTVSSA